jgi:hypothetical protein
VFRILTEDKNAEQIMAILNGFGMDFTLKQALGSWHGKREESLSIELDGITLENAVRAALAIKVLNEQEAVLLQEIPVTSYLL